MKKKRQPKTYWNEEARQEFLKLSEHIIYIYDHWNLIEALYTRRRTNFYKKFSPWIWGAIFYSILDEILTGICRVTDPPVTSGRKNITLLTLAETIRPQSKKLGMIADKIEARIKEPDIQRIRLHRNKRLSHSDYDFHLNKKILPNVSYADIAKILKDLFRLMDQVVHYGWGAKTMFHNKKQISSEADYLFDGLKVGKKYSKKFFSMTDESNQNSHSVNI